MRRVLSPAPLLGLACLGLGTAAAEPAWRLSLSGAAIDAEAETILSGTLGLERQIGAARLGASLTTTEGDEPAPESLGVADRSSLRGAVWWGAPLGPYDVTLTAALGRQTLEGAAGRSRAQPFTLDGEVDAWSLGAGLARSFGNGPILTPSLIVSYDRSETDLKAALGATPLLSSQSKADGVTAALGLDAAQPLGAGATVSIGAALIAASDAAAQTFTVSGRGGVDPVSQQEEGAAAWGDVYLGLDQDLTQALTLRATLGSTVGRESDEAFFEAGLTLRF